MNVQDAKELNITEGYVRTIHDSDGRQLWGRLAYDVKYRGNTTQQTYSGKNLFNNYDTTYIATNTNPGTVTLTTLPTGLKMDYPYSGNPWVLFKVGDMRNHKGKTIRLSMDYTSGAIDYRLMQLSADGTTRGVLATSTTSGETISFTIPANFDDADTMPYFGVRLYADPQSSVEFTNLILTVDNEDMTYESYVGGIPSPNPDYPQDINVVTGTQTITLTDGVVSDDFTLSLDITELCKIGDYQDFIYQDADGDWYVHKETNKIILVGANNESWDISNSGTANYFYYYRQLSDVGGTRSTFFSNMALYENISGSTTLPGAMVLADGTFKDFRIRYGSEMTVTNW